MTQTNLYSGGNVEDCLRQLNSLLRGEISAVKTYTMAIKKLQRASSANPARVSELQQMSADHGFAAQTLRDRIRELGGNPSDSSGAWGAWAQTVQGAANLLGDTSALKALKEGEEHGLKDYRQALDDVDATSAQMIQSQIVPTQERHIDLLNGLINSVGRA